MRNLVLVLTSALAVCFSFSAVAAVTDYTPVFLDCSRNGGQAVIVAIRRFQNNGSQQMLVVEANSLATRIVAAGELSCKPMDAAKFSQTHYSRIRNQAAQNRNVQANSGIRRFDRQEVTLTIDMCPSSKSYERRFYDWVRETSTPIAVAITAAWGLRHNAEFDVLKEMNRNGLVTWINHSYHHPYRRGVPNGSNFLLITGTNIRNEVLGNEIFMIENGLTPSVYFRFPGLISSEAIIQQIADWGLIALGSDAWLAKGESPQAGSVILLHGNGNEAAGISAFFRYLNQILTLGVGRL